MGFFDQSIHELLNLKPLIISQLKKLNITCVRDLLFFVPVGYITKKIDPNFDNIAHSDVIVTTIKIQSVPESIEKIKKFTAINNFNQSIQLIFFRPLPKFMWSYLKKHRTVVVEGKALFANGVWQIAHPEIIFNQSLIKTIEPVYNLTYGISNRQLCRYISFALNLLPEISSWHLLEQDLNLPSLRESLINLHDPSDLGNIDIYARRMALEEMLIHQILLNQLRLKNQSERQISLNQDLSSQESYSYYSQIIGNIGFTPTIDQQQVLQQIKIDQAADYRMTRIVQGDVGCGKTFVALLSMLDIISQGFQCAMMAPTEILSIQHYNFFLKALAGTNINIGLLTGSLKGKSRQNLLEQISSGKIEILIGTHALFQEKIVFKNLKYVVIDEQHRFGVKQRLDLIAKAENVDFLLMSATPIPRSLNMVIYGDMDVSYIKSKPKNNLPIITSIISDAKISQIVASLINIFQKQQKVYWICPLIEESEHKNYTNVLLRYEALKLVYQEKVGVLHGGMIQLDKDHIMEQFKNGSIDLLVATTVIEVGVDVPCATLIVIEDASAFGLSQLHQLRGRVGRSNMQSYCILMYKANCLSDMAKKRLNIIKNSNDGFEIAEQDLLLRGAGDFIGSKQSGQNSFIFSNFIADEAMLDIISSYIEQNPGVVPTDDMIRLFDKQELLRENILV